jgi:hypothetical protein
MEDKMRSNKLISFEAEGFTYEYEREDIEPTANRFAKRFTTVAAALALFGITAGVGAYAAGQMGSLSNQAASSTSVSSTVSQTTPVASSVSFSKGDDD